MKHVKKYYEENDVICDMTSGRKTFFPIMLNNERIADIEKGKDVIGLVVKSDLDSKTMKDVLEIYSNIVCHNIDEIEIFDIIPIEDFKNRYRFSRDRRRKVKYASMKDREGLRECILNNFSLVKHNGKTLFINKDKAKQIYDSLGPDNLFFEIKGRDEAYRHEFAFNIFDKENPFTFDTTKYGEEIFIKDKDDLKNVTLIFNNFDKLGYEHKRHFTIVINDKLREQLLKNEEAIILPKVEFTDDVEEIDKKIIMFSIGNTKGFYPNDELILDRSNIDKCIGLEDSNQIIIGGENNHKLEVEI